MIFPWENVFEMVSITEVFLVKFWTFPNRRNFQTNAILSIDASEKRKMTWKKKKEQQE